MPNQRNFGLLFFTFLLFSLSTTTSAQMSIDRIPVATEQEGNTVQREIRKTGPRYKNRRVASQPVRRKQTNLTQRISRRQLTSVAYKNKRFKRFGKMTENSAPRQRQLMGPAYKNRRFKVRRKRFARFKKRR